MFVTQRIHEAVRKLPESLQTEVLDFVEFLLTRVERNSAHQEEVDWSDFSLAEAMRGMEDEDDPTFSSGDMKVTFS